MDQAWKSVNGFIVSFTSGFDQLKIYFYTETENKHPWKLSITIEKDYIYLFYILFWEMILFASSLT